MGPKTGPKTGPRFFKSIESTPSSLYKQQTQREWCADHLRLVILTLPFVPGGRFGKRGRIFFAPRPDRPRGVLTLVR